MSTQRAIDRFEHAPTEPDRYVYRISSTGHSSARFGMCVVCNEYATEVFLQVEGMTYDNDGEIAITYYKCNDLFGHRECLLQSRRSTP